MALSTSSLWAMDLPTGSCEDVEDFELDLPPSTTAADLARKASWGLVSIPCFWGKAF